MNYQKIINVIDNTPNQPFKFRTKILVEIHEELRGTYNEDNQIRLKTLKVKVNLRSVFHVKS